MEQLTAQTEKIATYETARTRRSLIDENHSDDSNNDEEYATSGFYVREKNTDRNETKRQETEISEDNKSDIDCKENGVSGAEDSVESCLVNGGESKDSLKEEHDNSICKMGLELKQPSEASETTNTEEDENVIEKNGESKNELSNDVINSEPTQDIAEKVAVESEKESKQKSDDENNGSEVTSENNTEVEISQDKLENNISNDSEDISSNTNENNDENVVSDTDKKIEENTVGDIEDSVKSKEDSSDNVEEEKQTNCSAVTSEEDCDLTNQKQDTTTEDVVKTQHDDKDTISTETKSDLEDQKQVEIQNENKADQEKSDDIIILDDGKDDIKEAPLKEKDADVVEIEDSPSEQKDDKLQESKENKEGNSDEKINDEGSKSKVVIEEEDENDNKSKGEGTEVKENESDDGTKNGKRLTRGSISILKEHLEKPGVQGNDTETGDNDLYMDEDFDTSLLCPDISMDIDEAPVITNNEPVNDGNISPLPYEPVFAELVDEMTGAELEFNLTPQEMELRQKIYGPNNPVQKTKIHCTACNVHLGSALLGANNRFVHPLLKVLICKNCYHFYTSGEFEKDEDGSELYCRWCGQGGQVLCCSSCEFVFCKRCIRNNFGPRRFKEIRDSDDWNCFRCKPEQLANLRASCAEFMEYYRTELARAQTLAEQQPDLMTTDYTKCCSKEEKKPEEPKPPAPPKNPKRKRKESTDDPDYTPVVEEEEPPKKKFIINTSTSGGTPGYTIISSSSGTSRPVLPKSGVNTIIRPLILPQGQRQQTPQGQIFKVGNTTFRAKGSTGYTIQRPMVSTGPRNSSPGYIKLIPQRMPGSRPPVSTHTVMSGPNKSFTTVRPITNKPAPSVNSLEHEWFDKTVRATARVNSNLSYTLTQLNRQQSQADSVEALAMVHNKLQEVLSSSINSLIQIRKNLRTEFISGIKNIKFPPKLTPITPPPAPAPAPAPAPILVKDDDDVIFVNPVSTVSQIIQTPPPLILSPLVTLTKKTPTQKKNDPFTNPKPSTSGISTNSNTSTNSISIVPKGGFLKVRSFSALQNVTSECITIPDDPPAPPVLQKENIEDPLKITIEDNDEDHNKIELKRTNSKDLKVYISSKLEEINKRNNKTISNKTSTFNEHMVYNVREKPSPEVQKMLNAVVLVKRSVVVDEIMRVKGLLKESDASKKKNPKVKSS